MEYLDKNSLAVTLDALNDAVFYEHRLSKTNVRMISDWLVSRHGLKGSYANMFAPTESDFAQPVVVYTGEKLTSRASKAHILGEEAYRMLLLLGDKSVKVSRALKEADEGMFDRLSHEDRTPGMYCCGTCSAAYWRNLSAGGLRSRDRELRAGLKNLKEHRDGKGRYRRYPFWYTMLALSDIDLPGVRQEIKYATPVLERFIRREPADRYSVRRHDLAHRLLCR